MQHTIHILTLLLPLVGAATLSKRAVDRGTYQLTCQGGEGACNNAAFYINCISGGDNKITYLGPGKQNEQNRYESGCRAAIRQDGASGAQTGSSSSVCQQFPYGMQFIPDPDRLSQAAAEDYQCDEWPPASAEQPDYPTKTHPNSLRCITSAENLNLGNQLGRIYGGSTANTAGTTVPGGMAKGDYFKVTFDTTGADMSKLKYLKTPLDCTNDGFQFQMTKRPNKNGLISGSSPTANDNAYTLKGKTKAVGMCSIDFVRQNDDEFTDICVTDDANTDCAKDLKATIKGTTGSHAVKGLTQGDVTITKTGALGTKMKLEFGGIKWDTESKGTGKGPGGSRGQSTHLWCRTLDKAGPKPATGAAPTYKEYTCYFPC